MEQGVSLFLYRVYHNGGARSPAGRTLPDGRRQRTRLPVDLHFLATAWARKASLQHEIAGWMMRVLEDNPVLPQACSTPPAPACSSPRRPSRCRSPTCGGGHLPHLGGDDRPRVPAFRAVRGPHPGHRVARARRAVRRRCRSAVRHGVLRRRSVSGALPPASACWSGPHLFAPGHPLLGRRLDVPVIDRLRVYAWLARRRFPPVRGGAQRVGRVLLPRLPGRREQELPADERGAPGAGRAAAGVRHRGGRPRRALAAHRLLRDAAAGLPRRVPVGVGGQQPARRARLPVPRRAARPVPPAPPPIRADLCGHRPRTAPPRRRC